MVLPPRRDSASRRKVAMTESLWAWVMAPFKSICSRNRFFTRATSGGDGPSTTTPRSASSARRVMAYVSMNADNAAASVLLHEASTTRANGG